MTPPLGAHKVAILGSAASTGYAVEYLCIAGGGGGGDVNPSNSAGGGGAGGMLEGTDLILAAGVQYTITIGGGAAAIDQSQGNEGTDSTITGSGLTTITSVGGGGGGAQDHNTGSLPTGNKPGTNGGSGGGGAWPSGQGGDGTAGQGNDGGNGAGGDYAGAGGGGGKGAAGGNAPTNTVTVGGAGGASDIIEADTDVTYAGGGGAAFDGGVSAGGSGGGGAGTVAGTANTGGGGGGGAATHQPGAAGGSGLIVLRMLSSNYSGTISGSPTESTDGSYKVLKYTGSGTYTG